MLFEGSKVDQKLRFDTENCNFQLSHSEKKKCSSRYDSIVLDIVGLFSFENIDQKCSEVPTLPLRVDQKVCFDPKNIDFPTFSAFTI